ncbi:MAG: hypothetical protein WB770_06530 [Acidimicrobiales bacterium]
MRHRPEQRDIEVPSYLLASALGELRLDPLLSSAAEVISTANAARGPQPGSAALRVSVSTRKSAAA